MQGSFTHDVLILGRGLAGAVLVHHLTQNGLRCHVFHSRKQGDASTVAAGVVNPISLRRDILTWRAVEMLSAANACYRTMEVVLGKRFWHSIDLIKIFPTHAEADQWHRALAREETAPILEKVNGSTKVSDHIHAPHGYGTVRNCAWLDLSAILNAQHSWLTKNEMITETVIEKNHIVVGDHGIQIGKHSAPWLIHCSGGFATCPGLIPVKGEVLTVRIPRLELKHIIHRGVFVLPLGGDLYRIGSTYEWNDVWSPGSNEAVQYLLEKLAQVISLPAEVIDHSTGVRPTSKDRRPLLGVSSPHQAIFNGLGSRGVMIAPWCADHLIAHLIEGKPLDPEVDLARFTSP